MGTDSESRLTPLFACGNVNYPGTTGYLVGLEGLRVLITCSFTGIVLAMPPCFSVHCPLAG